MRKALRTLAIASVASALVPVTTVPAASAEPTTYVLRTYNADGKLVSEVGDTSGAADVACSSWPEYPHWSPPPRANSVLFKTRVKCEGQGAPPQIRVSSVLGFVPGDPAGPPPPPQPVQPRATEDRVQTVAVPGEQTWYTPVEGAPVVHGSGWYTGGYEAEFAAPVTGPIGNGDTPLVPVTTP